MKTATITRYHVWGTPHHCLALLYRGQELTPNESPTCPIPQLIPDDNAGMLRLLTLAYRMRFTHVQHSGEYRTTPPGGRIADQFPRFGGALPGPVSTQQTRAAIWGVEK